MVNTNIQAKVPLIGVGLKYRPERNYNPGEFAVFQNLEVYENQIRCRRPIWPCSDGADYGAGYTQITRATPMTTFTGFGGMIRDRVVATSTQPSRSWQIGGAVKRMNGLFSSLTLPTFAGGHGTNTDTKGHWLLAAFNYGLNTYYITQKYEFNVGHEMWLYWHPTTTGTEIQTSDFPTNSVKIITLPHTSIETFAHAVFKDFFIHKDRLFILTNDKLYYSKATDPTNFTSPDGGFIDVDSGDFFAATALSDSIYLSTNNKAYVFTYSTDPAKDGLMRTIYTGTKITAWVIHDDLVYASTRSDIFLVSNLNFERVLDLTTIFKAEPIEYSTIKMLSFGESIIIMRGFVNKWGKWIIPKDNFRRTFFYNTENQSVSELVFRDGLSYPASQHWGVIMDMAVNRELDYLVIAVGFGVDFNINGNPNTVVAGNAENIKTRFYFMDRSRTNRFGGTDDKPSSVGGVDKIFIDGTTATTSKVRIDWDMQIENWSPDGTEYLNKKFRDLSLTGTLPVQELDTPGFLTVYFDYYDITNDKNFVFNDIPKTSEYDTAPFSWWIRLNQKARNLKFRLYNNALDSYNTEVALVQAKSDGYEGFYFMIEDMRVRYTYTEYQGRERVPTI